MNAKHTTRLMILLAAPLLTFPTLAFAQATKAAKKGFDTAPGSAKRKAVVPAVVVPDAAAPRRTELRKLNQAGTTSSDRLTLKVDSIEVWSQGVMRFNYSVFNPSEQDKSTDIVFQQCYLADSEGNRYASLANDQRDNGRGDHRLTVQAGTKAPFWIEFKTPEKPTNAFKVGLAVNTNFGAPFKPFIVTLTKPIPDQPEEAPAEEVEEAPAAPGAAVATKPAAARGAMAEPPTATAKLTAAAKRFKASGLNYEGNVRLKDGTNSSATFVFENIPGESSAIQAIVTSPKIPELEGTLTGRIVEKGGNLTIVLIGPDGATYKLAVQAKILTGTDSEGRKFTLRAK